MNHRLARAALSAGILSCLCSAAAAAEGSGFFRYDKLKMDIKYAYAFVHPQDDGPDQTLVYLTSLPIDPKPVADAFDQGDQVNEQMRGKSGGYVRVCIDAEGKECGLYFSHDEPSESFNMSGSGVFKLDQRTPQLKGRWKTDKPEEFFAKTYELDLVFAVAPTAPTPGQALPADGGAPGKAYQAYLAALAKGDLPALRTMLGESSRWQLPDGDATQSKQGLKDLRDGKPVSVRILSGVQRGSEAVLKVEGTDRDEIKRVGRVRMLESGGAWRVDSQSLSAAG